MVKGTDSPERHLHCVCRLSSDIFPWCTEYQLKELKDFEAISDELAFAGKLARAYDQRLTFHPSHFVKLAAETDELLNKSIKELEVHSLVRHIYLCAYAHASIHSRFWVEWADEMGGVLKSAEHRHRHWSSVLSVASGSCLDYKNFYPWHI